MNFWRPIMCSVLSNRMFKVTPRGMGTGNSWSPRLTLYCDMVMTEVFSSDSEVLAVLIKTLRWYSGVSCVLRANEGDSRFMAPVVAELITFLEMTNWVIGSSP